MCVCVCVQLMTTRPLDYVILFVSGSWSLEVSAIHKEEVDRDYIDVPRTSIFNNRHDMLMKD